MEEGNYNESYFSMGELGDNENPSSEAERSSCGSFYSSREVSGIESSVLEEGNDNENSFSMGESVDNGNLFSREEKGGNGSSFSSREGSGNESFSLKGEIEEENSFSGVVVVLQMFAWLRKRG